MCGRGPSEETFWKSFIGISGISQQLWEIQRFENTLYIIVEIT